MENSNQHRPKFRLFHIFIIVGLLCFLSGIILLCNGLLVAAFCLIGTCPILLILGAIINRLTMSSEEKAQLVQEREEEKLKTQREKEVYEREQREIAEREQWKATHIKKAVIVATRVGKNNGSAILRGVVGDALIGTSGAVIGTSTAKQKQFTTFLLVYEDDTRETKEVENGSPLYQTYINYIEI